jgi:hypothetical protein
MNSRTSYYFYILTAVIKRLVVVLALLILVNHPLFSQEDSVESKVEKVVDSLFLDHDKRYWSVRALANFKDNRFKLKNNGNTLSYTPNNPSGVGVGFANSKFRLDLILNIKTNKEEVTDRFDMQGDMMIKQNVFLFQIQNYQGFNVTNNAVSDSEEFRRDIRSFSASLNFFHVFKPDVKTLTSIYSGINMTDKSAGSFLAGFYSNYHIVQGDSSIVPRSSESLFNEEAQIEKMNKFGIGISGGYAYFLSLPANFFMLVAATPGFGINFKKIRAETLTYKPDQFLELYLYANISVGYNGPKYYVEIGSDNIWNFSTLGNGNTGSMNSTKFKLAVGWKFVKL